VCRRLVFDGNLAVRWIDKELAFDRQFTHQLEMRRAAVTEEGRVDSHVDDIFRGEAATTNYV